ncbi:MAG: hypothetical protein QOE31_463 [Solirubrobacteraceae bacterium]|nr:hypothetical protein [Solirubrobacteraceae bacterium]
MLSSAAVVSRPRFGRLRGRLAPLAVTLCALAAIAGGNATAANAAGPNNLNPGETVTYPTWAWWSTKLCAFNFSSSSWGAVGVSPFGSAYEQFYVAPYSTNCIARSWYGNPIKVINIGGTTLRTSTQ